MRQISYFLLLLQLLLLITPSPLFAQSAMSECTIVKVGNPSGTPVLPPGCVSTGSGSDATDCSYKGTDGLKKPGNLELAQFANQAANKLGVPPAVVLGIMRIETPDAFKSTDKTYFTNDYDANPSPAGAIGIMQFLPSTFEWTFQANQKDMQSAFSKISVIKDVTPAIIPPPIDSILRITSIRDSIISTTFKVRMDKEAFNKTSPWDEESVREVARRYQGACPYPGGGSYCDDLWASVKGCSTTNNPGTTTQPGSHPVAPEVPDGNYVKAISEKFEINMSGFPVGDLRAAWEKFNEVSNTKFISLIKGTTVYAVGSGSEQTGCRTVNIRNNTNDPVLFKVLLTHELGHIIVNCNEEALDHQTDQLNALAVEGGITAYGDKPCYEERYKGGEDYAEMIAYYLNPGVSERTNCGTREVIPYANGAHPLHLAVVKRILGDF
jgi:hypothetical protein